MAACPGGTISNFYACLARANSALSITLTAISCLLSFVTLPVLVAAGFFFWLDDQPEVEVPMTVLVIQLLFLVALPTCLGMILRRWRPAATEKRDLALRRVSLIALVALVVYVVFDQRVAMTSALGELTLAAVVFTFLAMTAGYSLAWVTGRPPADRLTYLIEFPCRNLALALVVAVTVLDRPEFASFATVLLLVQALVILTMVAFLRRANPRLTPLLRVTQAPIPSRLVGSRESSAVGGFSVSGNELGNCAVGCWIGTTPFRSSSARQLRVDRD